MALLSREWIMCGEGKAEEGTFKVMQWNVLADGKTN